MKRARANARYAVVMAGGFGTRFWPHSRRRSPKQFLPIRGRRSMLQETVRRLAGSVPADAVLVVAAREFASLVRTQLPELPRRNLLMEPAPRGTAACLALAAEWIAARDADAVMGVFPADHVITETEPFRRALRRAFDLAEGSGALVTFGIAPTYAETGFGYIEPGEKLASGRPAAYRVARFHEKPDLATARSYIDRGPVELRIFRIARRRHSRLVRASRAAIARVGACAARTERARRFNSALKRGRAIPERADTRGGLASF